MIFTSEELAYLAAQPLGRLATVAPDGTLQNNPVGFEVNAEEGFIDIGGWRMGESRKFTNIQQNPEVSFVVDDVVSLRPWTVRGMEIRGRAEAVTGVLRGEGDFLSGEVIRIRPRRIRNWGIPDGEAGSARWTGPQPQPNEESRA